jgi:hypothetical protein
LSRHSEHLDVSICGIKIGNAMHCTAARPARFARSWSRAGPGNLVTADHQAGPHQAAKWLQ